MNKLKKILVCVFTFLISLTMFGCAEVNYKTKLYSGGEIISSIEITFDQSLIQQKASPILKEYFKQLDNAYYRNLRTLYSQVYDFTSLEILDPIEQNKYILEHNTKFTISEDINSSDDYVEFDNSDPNHKKIKIQKTFISIYAYVMYFYPSAYVYDEATNTVKISNEYKSLIDIPFGGSFEEEEKLFVSKAIQTCVPFYYNGEEAKFLEDGSGNSEKIKAGYTLQKVLTDELTQWGLNDEQVKLIFSFSTPYKRVHSNGQFSETDDGYTHTWTLASMSSEVKFWRTYANQVAWYVIGASAGVVVLIVGAVVILAIKNKKKRQGLKALKQLDALARNKEIENQNQDKKES